MSSMYLQVTQDAGAVILFDRTPKQLQVLFTNNLASCIAIMAKGELGVALLHDGGKLSEESIQKVFKLIGKIEYWTTAFYPYADQEYKEQVSLKVHQEKYGEKGIYATNFERINQIMSAILSPESKGYIPQGIYHPATARMAAIDREGNIYTQNNQFKIPLLRFEQPDFAVRETINQLKNGYISAGEYFDCDLQYDGEKKSPLPKLPIPIEEYKKLYASNPHIMKVCENFERFKKEYSEFVSRHTTQVNTLLKKYKANSKGQALRRAANAGEDLDIRFLVKKAGADVNEQGPESGKTALHIAASKSLISTILLLKSLGAKDDISDFENITAASLLEKLDLDE